MDKNRQKLSFLASKLFNNGGYIMDYSTAKFDEFTSNSIGIELCSKYGLSKGRSLEKFVDEEELSVVINLLDDLLEYYDLAFKQYRNIPKIEGEDYYYSQLKEHLDMMREKSIHKIIESSIEDIIKAFDSAYIDQQLNQMTESIETNPSDAIGKAKELVESCCKTILTYETGRYDDKDNLLKLSKKTRKLLHITPEDVKDTQKNVDSIIMILGSLSTIIHGLAELRNNYGSGHGKDAGFKGLTPKHARLAVGASVTLVQYLWSTYKEKQKNPRE